jgi:ATP-dependent DNA ligase
MKDIRNELNIELLRCKGAYLESAPEEVWNSSDWIMEQKIDGIRASLQLGDHPLFVGRNRRDKIKGIKNAKSFMNLNNGRKSIVDSLKKLDACIELEGTLLDGELTYGELKNGDLDKKTKLRRENNEYCGYWVWDVIFYKGVDIRDFRLHKRKELLPEIVKNINSSFIREIITAPTDLNILKEWFEQGYEGAIVKNIHASIPKNSKTNNTWWKVKGDDYRTIDAFIIGVTEGKEGGSPSHGIKPIPSGKACRMTLGMIYNDQVVEVGKMANLPKECEERGFKEFNLFENKVVEVIVSGWDGERLRWPRFLKWRKDKTPNDCQFDEQIGDLYIND